MLHEIDADLTTAIAQRDEASIRDCIRRAAPYLDSDGIRCDPEDMPRYDAVRLVQRGFDALDRMRGGGET